MILRNLLAQIFNLQTNTNTCTFKTPSSGPPDKLTQNLMTLSNRANHIFSNLVIVRTPSTVWTEKTTINNFHQTHPPPFFIQKVWKENFLPCWLNSNNLIYLHHMFFPPVSVLAVWTLIDCMYNDYVYI